MTVGDGTTQKAWTFVAQKTQAGLQPTRRYLRHLIAGALRAVLGWIAMASALLASCGPQPVVQPSDSLPSAVHPAFPAPIPVSCSVAPLRFERRQGFEAYWIDGLNLAAGLPTGVLRDGENKIQWQGEGGDLVVGGRSLNDTGEVQLVNPVRLGVGIYSTSTVFPHAGCWRLTATMGAGSFDAVVYVFPK